MKPYLLLLSFLFAHALSAQVNDWKTIKEGKKWQYVQTELNEDRQTTDIPFYITVGAQATFEGKDCMTLYFVGETETKVCGYAYETDKGEVYVYNTLELKYATFLHKGWRKTFDFSLNTGEAVPMADDTNSLVMTGKDTIEVRGKLYPRILSNFQTRSGNTHTTNGNSSICNFVCGAGNDIAGLFAPSTLHIDSYPTYAYIGCYGEDEECIMTASEYSKANIQSEIVFRTINGTKDGKKYDISGKVRTSNATQKMFIKDGKKYMR